MLIKNSAFEHIQNSACDILGCEAEFLIKHLVGSRSTEMVKTEDAAVGDNTAQRAGQAGGETKRRHAGGNYLAAIFSVLIEEQAD